jgi:hypothetical protein
MAKVLGLVSVWPTDRGPAAVVFAQTGRCPLEREYCLAHSLCHVDNTTCPEFSEVDTEDAMVLINCHAADVDDVEY